MLTRRHFLGALAALGFVRGPAPEDREFPFVFPMSRDSGLELEFWSITCPYHGTTVRPPRYRATIGLATLCPTCCPPGDLAKLGWRPIHERPTT